VGQASVFSRLLDQECRFYLDETLYTWNSHVNSWNNRFQSMGSPFAVSGVPLHDVGIWCAVKFTEGNWAHFFSLNKFWTLCEIDHPFLNQCTDEEKLYQNFMQDNAVASTVSSVVDALNEVFGKQVVSWGFWSLQSSSLNPGEFLFVCRAERRNILEESTLRRTSIKY
jgi:hypothetical protein